MKIGYARVSTVEQNLDMQITALESYGCDRIFQEKISGIKKRRPEFEKMLEMLRPGDTVVVFKLDRLGRSVKQLVFLLEDWMASYISLHVVSDGVTFNDTPMSKMIYNIMSAFAQMERDLISERTKAGLAEARRRGRFGGRPKGISDTAKKLARIILKLHEAEIMSVRDIMHSQGVKSTSTYYKYLKWAKNEREILHAK